jgi:hypothetical protein
MFLKFRLPALWALLLCLGSTPAHAVGVQVVTDFALHYDNSPSSQGAASLMTRDSGFSWRWRLAWKLMTRNERDLELLAGPYVRIPIAFSLTNYGTEFKSTSQTEFGGDIGISWFSYAKTFLTFAPDWNLSYQTSETALIGGSGDRLAEVSYKHWSVGVRVEIPFFVLESDPGDRKVEFGGLGVYQVDHISSFTIEPVNFVPTDSERNTFNRQISGSQAIGSRWMIGAFMNFRL